MLLRFFILSCIALLAMAPVGLRASELRVFAAASLGSAMAEIAQGYETATGTRVRVSLAGSSALARQIEAGAPADIFISANPGWMNRLQDAGRIDADSRFDLVGNRIVLIAHAALPPGPTGEAALRALPDLLGGGRLAMALVEAVPAGIYGKAALDGLGLWAQLAPSVAQADNVRAALALVASGAAPYGIVYATDAVADQRVRVIARFDPASHPPVVYPAAIVTGARPEARPFLRYLAGDAAAAILAAQGFALPEG